MSQHFFIITDSLGQGERELGTKLMKNFLYSLARAEQAPAALSFMNDGVRLTCEGSESLEDLQVLAEKGVQIRSCGTCLDYYQLKDKLKVGEVGTMPQAVESCLSLENTIVIR